MSLSDVDRILLQRCLDHDPRAWRDFVDRFIGLVLHVVQRTASGRGIALDEATRDDLVAEIFLVFLRHDMAVLRRFQRQSSLATYLTVVSRRVVIRKLVQWQRQKGVAAAANHSSPDSATDGIGGERSSTNPSTDPKNARLNGHPTTAESAADPRSAEQLERIEDAEQLEQLLLRLDAREASVVKMFHLEGKSYAQISRAVGINENSIGSVLHRARLKMRNESEP